MGNERQNELKTVILSDRSPDENRNARERERFGIFARALGKGGIKAEHRFTGDEDEIRALLATGAPDLVFSASLMSAPGTRGPRSVHAILEEGGQPYVGSDPAAIELAIDKAALKERWLREGIRTPAFFRVAAGEAWDEGAARAVGFPCIVKPEREGNSRGIGEDSVVGEALALRAKVEDIVARYGSAIVERFVGDTGDVREFTVAMLGSGRFMLAMPAEISLTIPKAVRVVTTEDKDAHRTSALPVRDPALRARVELFAREAFRAAGVRDYARCDLILSGRELYAIEINGQPMVPDRWFQACAAGAGLDETGYLNAIALAALARLAREGRPGVAVPEAMRGLVPARVYDALAGRGGN